jgi:thiamine-phosphate pyrophosphorylase
MNSPTPPNRCRIVLIAPAGITAEAQHERLKAALSGGDVASLIVPQYGLDEDAFQTLAERLVPEAQAAGVAVVLAGDTRVAGRIGADGIHVESGRDELAETIERLQGRMMVGAGGAKDRDTALDLGELRPDYIFFGRFGYDTLPEPHSRNLALGSWWADVIEIPCIVQAGSVAASVEAVGMTGAEFVALGTAVFADAVDPRAAVAEANAVLERTAPKFGTAR